jgi:Family of unknown function (DUF5681)
MELIMSESEGNEIKVPGRDTRFKPGVSGNPRGRPKASLNIGSELYKVLGKPIRVRENGKDRKVSALLAIVHGLCANALRGDVKATKQLFDMLAKHGLRPIEPPGPEPVSDNDRLIIERFLQRNATQVTLSDSKSSEGDNTHDSH